MLCKNIINKEWGCDRVEEKAHMTPVRKLTGNKLVGENACGKRESKRCPQLGSNVFDRKNGGTEALR